MGVYLSKVIHICQYLMHGSGKGTLQIIKLLNSMGFEQELILPEPYQGFGHGYRELDLIRKLELKVHWVHSTFLRETWTRQSLSTCINKVLGGEPASIMTHGGFSAYVLQSMGLRFTHFCHGFGLTRSHWVDTQDLKGIGSAYRVLVASNDIGSQCLRLGVPSEKVYLHYYPLDLSFRRPKKICLGDCVHLGQVGNFIKQKGHKYSLLVLQSLVTFESFKGRAFKLHFFGMGPLQNDVKEMASKMGLTDKVFFHGHCHQDKIYSEIDIMLLPSLVEGLGLVNVEAIENGIPICAFNVGGVGELIEHGKTGLLSTVEDVEAMALNVKMLTEMPDLGEKLTKCAQVRLRRMFDPPGGGSLLTESLTQAF